MNIHFYVDNDTILTTLIVNLLQLLKLQQRVGFDERFKIDKRFLDDGHLPESLENIKVATALESGDSTNVDDIEGERSRALSILDRLLGTKSAQKNSRKLQ